MSAKNLSYIFICLNLVLLFHNVPMFIIAICLIALFMNIFVNIIRPSINFFKIILLFVSLFLLFKKFKTLLVVEFGVSLVLLLSFLKALELETLDDFFNMFLILILSEACLFIINPNAIIFILGILKIGFFFYFLLKMRNYSFFALDLKKLLTLIIPASIFSLLMFFTFPRFTQGFLNVNNSGFLFSGASHELKFKELGPINLSDKEVFKVLNFPLEKISNNYLYWRTNVLWDFRKGTWRTSYAQLKRPIQIQFNLKDSSNFFNYQIKMPNQYVDFLPHFDSESILSLENYNFNYYSENTFKLSPGQLRAISFQLTSRFKHEKSEYDENQKRKGINLFSDQKSTILQMLIGNKKENNLSLVEKLKIINKFFTDRNYIYSISPPSYDSLEDFILNGKIGYCSHFASTYAYLLRLLNIPARIIIGYLGGDINSFDGSIVVKEKDAHAWVEYFDGKNWLRIDPTELVAPARITDGSSRFYDNLNPFIGNSFYRIPKSWVRFTTFDKFSQFSDFLENQLSSNLFNFDREDQLKFFKTNGSIYFVIIIIIFMSSGYVVSKLSRSVTLSKEEREYLKFLKKMKKIGFPKLKHETTTEFRERLVSTHSDILKENSIIIDKYLFKTYRQKNE